MISNLKSVEENKEYLRSVIGLNIRSHIDWENSVGKEIEYEYIWKETYTKGVFKIVGYELENQKIYFEEYEKGIYVGNLTRCKLGGILNFISFKYEIGTIINNLTIIDKEYRYDKKHKLKYYKYHCNKCNNEGWIKEGKLKEGGGCNACCLYGKKAVLGINTIWDKARWMVDFGVSEEDAKTHTPCSAKKITVKCPDCGKFKKVTPNIIYQTHSIQCSCGDGISYPEKLMESVLIQLGVEYEKQYKPDWSQNKRYDFYLSDIDVIIETHGIQHYKCSNRGRSLKEEQESDELKEELALKNGIKNYIVIDCRESELEYIRVNMLGSELNKLFDLSNINWEKCNEYGLKNKVKEVCDYYKEHLGISTTDLAKKLGVSRKTIIKYLKQGAKMNWCEYDAKESMRRNGETTSKPVSQFSIKGEFIKGYPSINEARRQTGIDNSSISACCKGKYKTAGGYVWEYA